MQEPGAALVVIVVLIIYFVNKNKNTEPHVKKDTANNSNVKSSKKNENYYDRDKTYYSSGERYHSYAAMPTRRLKVTMSLTPLMLNLLRKMKIIMIIINDR